MSERIERLQQAVEKAYECKARHVVSEEVTDLFQGEVAWDAVVATFELQENPKAKRCFGWSYGEPEQFITIFELPPVDSAIARSRSESPTQIKNART